MPPLFFKLGVDLAKYTVAPNKVNQHNINTLLVGITRTRKTRHLFQSKIHVPTS